MKPQPTLNCVGLIWKRSIKDSPCHPELAAPLVAAVKETYKGGRSQSISGSGHRQKCATICTVSWKKVLDKVGCAFSPTLKYCWGRNPNLQKAISSASRTAQRHVRGDLVPAFTLAEVFLPYYRSPRKIAFTLAEVLITLGIIGVVAAMTLPTLIANYQEKVTVTKLKKAYSVLNSAYKMAVVQHGTIDQWGLTTTSTGSTNDEGQLILDPSGMQKAIDIMTPYLGVKPQDNSFLGDYTVYTMQGTVLTSGGTGVDDVKSFFQLKDGTIINFGWTNSDNMDIAVWFPNKRNQFTTGKDIFYFTMVKNGVYPYGIENKNISAAYPFPDECSISSTLRTNGRGCAAWVIYNENMDYLKCDGLSWDGKHKCK